MGGDEAVISAIVVSLDRINPGVPVFVILEVGGPEDEQSLSSRGVLRLRWLHRTVGPGEDPELQLQVVRTLDLPKGRGQAFVHGEAESVLRVRRHLLQERGRDPDDLSASGYWELRRTDEQWRAEKPDWIARAVADLPGPVAWMAAPYTRAYTADLLPGRGVSYLARSALVARAATTTGSAQESELIPASLRVMA